MSSDDNCAEYFSFKEYDEVSKIQNVKGRVQDGDRNLNKFGIIDGARIQGFDESTKTLTIRVNDTNVPGFWMEIPLKLEQVEKWIKNNVEKEYVPPSQHKVKTENFMNLAWF